jgi:hypothetical protein
VCDKPFRASSLLPAYAAFLVLFASYNDTPVPSLNAPQVYARESLFELRDDEEIRRRLAYWLEEIWQRNQDRIDQLGRYFFAAAVALILLARLLDGRPGD